MGFMVAIHFVGLAVEVLDVAWILRLNVAVVAVLYTCGAERNAV